MKRFDFRIVRFSLTIFIMISIMGVGCERQDDDILPMEIGPDSKDQIIQNTIDGIGFKFCLLNEQGEASTVFYEGENFSFLFSVTNYRTDDFYFVPDYARENENDFCRVYTAENSDLGKPFELLYALGIGMPGYPFNPGESYDFEATWCNDTESVWFFQNGTYSSTKREQLNKGSYYTRFKSKFYLKSSENSPENDIRIDTLSFKINFEVR